MFVCGKPNPVGRTMEWGGLVGLQKGREGSYEWEYHLVRNLHHDSRTRD